MRKDKGMLQTDLNKFTSLAQKWKMEFNVAKCKVMHKGNNNNEFSYEMNGKVLDKVLIEKDLGIMISNSTKLNSTGDYGRRCLTPLCPHH